MTDEQEKQEPQLEQVDEDSTLGEEVNIDSASEISTENQAQTESGAIAQGEGAIAVSERGVNIGGNVAGDLFAGDIFIVQAAKDQQDKRTEEKERELRERQITLHQVEIERFREQCQVFVPPPSYEKVIQELTSSDKNRILLVAGENKSGKQTYAINLANWIFDNKLKHVGRKAVWFYTDRRTDQTLINMISDDKSLPKHSIVIIEEVIQHGLLSEDIDLGPVDLNDVLLSRDLYFILTASVPIEKTATLDSKDILFGYTNDVELEKVIKKLIDYHFDENVYPKEFKKLQEIFDNAKLKKIVTDRHNTPSKLSRFFRKLKSNPDILWEKEIIAELNLLDTQVAKAWFDTLKPFNYRLYAMMAVLFETLEVQSLESLYVEIVRFLREEEGLNLPEQFIDPRLINIQELRDRTALHESGAVLEFEDDNYRQIVIEQLKNHYWLLWSIRKYLVKFIKTLRNSNNSRYQGYDDCRRVRDNIAAALANIGIYYLPELKDLLAELVKDEEAFVVVTSSSILRVLAETKQHDDFIVEVLKKWIGSKNYDQIWAACISIGRLYSLNTNKTASKTPNTESTQESYLHDKLDEYLTYISKNYRDQKLDRDSLKEQLRDELFEIYGEPDEEERNEFEDALEELIDRQIQNIFNEIRLALVGAFRDISIAHPQRALQLMESWLESENSRHHYEHVRMTLNHIWQESAKTGAIFLERYAFPNMIFLAPTLKASQGLTVATLFHFISLIAKWDTMQLEERERHSKVGQLLEQEPIDTAATAMLKWFEASKNSFFVQERTEVPTEKFERKETLWEHAVLPQLTTLITKATRSERLLLTGTISRKWGQVDGESDAILRVMQTLLTHGHVLNGELTSIPTGKFRGLVIVDGDSRLSDDNYFSPILQFIRTISGILPVDIYRLGDNRQYFTTGNSPIKNGQLHSIVTLQELHVTGQQRPPLLMPIVMNSSQAYSPEECAFIVVFNSRPIIDIQDMFPTISPDSNKQAINISRLEQDWLKKQQDVSRQSNQWDWANRIFLADLTGVPVEYYSQVNEIYRDTFSLEQHLMSLVGQTQSRMSTEIIESQLKEYATDLPWPDNFEDRVRDWIDIFKADKSPIFNNIDVAQAIACAFALEVHGKHLQTVCAILSEWLQEVPKLDITRSLAIAITRILFQVAMSNQQTSLDRVDTIMNLLPTFSAEIEDYSEILPILEKIIEWARSKRKVNYFAKNENLTKSLHNIDVQKFQYLHDWLSRYRILLAFTEFFVSVGQPIKAFRRMLDEVRIHLKNENRNQAHHHPALEIAAHLPEAELNDFLRAFQTDLINNNETFYWIVLKLTQLHGALNDPLVVETAIKHMNSSAENMQRIIQKRLRGTLPQLEDGHFYGVILVDAASKNALELAKNVMTVFAKKCPGNLSLILHHLGNPTIIQQIDSPNQLPSPQSFQVNNVRPTVLGPALTRYTHQQDQVAFVIVVTHMEVIDYDDWVEMNDAVWLYRICVVTTNNRWTPKRGERVSISDNSSIIELANRLFGRIEQ